MLAGRRWVLMHEMREENELKLEDILAKLEPCDLVIIEGFKSYPHPKIEATRAQTKRDLPLWPNDNSIVAIAADYPIENCDRTVFNLNDIKLMSDFILKHLKLG